MAHLGTDLFSLSFNRVTRLKNRFLLLRNENKTLTIVIVDVYEMPFSWLNLENFLGKNFSNLEQSNGSVHTRTDTANYAEEKDNFELLFELGTKECCLYGSVACF